MVVIFLFDRNGGKHTLPVTEGQHLWQALLQNMVPPTSVVIKVNGKIATDDVVLQGNDVIEAYLIEKYDISSLIKVYNELFQKVPGEHKYDYVDKFLSINESGMLKPLVSGFDLKNVVKDVEMKVNDTIKEFSLLDKGDNVLIGLSGGVDSTSLMMSLASQQTELGFSITTATVANYEVNEATFAHAAELSDKFNINHNIIEATTVESNFNLNLPLIDVYSKMMQSKFKHYTMYLDHHFMKRSLEVFADNNNILKIALGLHASDIMGGLLNGFVTGHRMTDLPLKKIGNKNFIYPLAFILKKELFMYHFAKTGKEISHARPNEWEFVPLDRNLYYYISDILQMFWPGINHWAIAANKEVQKRLPEPEFLKCANCGTLFLKQAIKSQKEDMKNCDICEMLYELNMINS